VEQNKKLGNRIRNVLKGEQDKIDDMNLAAAQDEERKPKRNAREEHEMRLRRTQIAAQSRRFFDLWAEYNNFQVDYRDRSKEILKRRCRIVNEKVSEEEIETMLDEGKTQMFNASILEDTRAAREQLNELKDRRDEFLKLEQSIRDVHDLFQELAALVSQQGELINSIAYNVEIAQDKVESGKKQLAAAESHQKSARRKKVICSIIAFVVCFILLLVILYELGAFNSSGKDVPPPNPPAPEPEQEQKPPPKPLPPPDT